MPFATYDDALDALPEDATWSCSFGYPGQPGFAEYFHTKDTRYIIRNDREWWAVRPFSWTLEIFEKV